MNSIKHPEPANGIDELEKEEDIIIQNTRYDDNRDQDEHNCAVADLLEDIKPFLFRS